MNRFKKILVPIDLSNDIRFVIDELSLRTQEVIQSAELIAKETNAALRFFHVLPPGAKQLTWDREILMGINDEYKSVEDYAREILESIVESSKKSNIKASCDVVFGTSWIEVVREVIRNEHDLVLAGTRKRGALQRMLFASTGLKLLRKCPCPVWLTKSKSDVGTTKPSVLVAHDLSKVGESALKLGSDLARSRNKELHVIHVIENRYSGKQKSEYLARDEASREIHRQLHQLNVDAAKVRPHITVGDADEEILNCINEQQIELIVMGTIARTGIGGMLTGNTAEKLLPQLSCSILAIKPDDFISPVSLSDPASVSGQF